VRGTFLTIKHFLLSVKKSQEAKGSELENVAIVITGSETGKFGQEGHAEFVLCDSGLRPLVLLMDVDTPMGLSALSRMRSSG